MDDTPFDVTEEVEISDLSEVKPDRMVIPATQNVLFRISKITIREVKPDSEQPKSADNPVIKKSLNMEIRLEEGIDEAGKYKNAAVFSDITLWVDNTHQFYSADRFQKATKPYLNDLKLFLSALGYDITQPPKVNDEFLAELLGRQIRGNITVRQIRTRDDSTGQWKDTGDTRNAVGSWKAA